MKKILLCSLAAAMFFSCYEDKGNYNYTTINEVTIEFDRSTYSVVAYNRRFP